MCSIQKIICVLNTFISIVFCLCTKEYCCNPSNANGVNAHMMDKCQTDECQFDTYCRNAPAYTNCLQSCGYESVCVSGLSQEFDGEYAFDGKYNRGGKAPSWKKSGGTSDYYLYWHYDKFYISSDETKKRPTNSMTFARCSAPGDDGFENPDDQSNGGDCVDNTWYYSAVGSNVDASVKLGQCTFMNPPTNKPTNVPTVGPTNQPTNKPTLMPTLTPTKVPTFIPSKPPSNNPSKSPTNVPSLSANTPCTQQELDKCCCPTCTSGQLVNDFMRSVCEDDGCQYVWPTCSVADAYHTCKSNLQCYVPPTKTPTQKPTNKPSMAPTIDSTQKPTKSPSTSPTRIPSKSPTKNPSEMPTNIPTDFHSPTLTLAPPYAPTQFPSTNPSIVPTSSSPFPTMKNNPILHIPSVTGTRSDHPNEEEVVYHATSQYISSTSTSSTLSAFEEESFDPFIIIVSVGATAFFCAICFILLFVGYKIRQRQVTTDIHSNLEEIASASPEYAKHDNKETDDHDTPKVSIKVSNSLTVIKDHLARLTPTSSADIEVAEMYNKMTVGSTEGHTMENTTNHKTRRGTLSIENNIIYDGSEQVEIREWLHANCGELICKKYFCLFISNGYQSLDFIKEIESKRDLEDIGIDLKGHQTAIWSAIRKLKNDIT